MISKICKFGSEALRSGFEIYEIITWQEFPLKISSHPFFNQFTSENEPSAALILLSYRLIIILCHKGYRKFPKYSDTQKVCSNHSKIWTMWLYNRLRSPNDADEMANSVDPDQTALLGAVWSGSTLFAQAFLSGKLGSLRYVLMQTLGYFNDLE